MKLQLVVMTCVNDRGLEIVRDTFDGIQEREPMTLQYTIDRESHAEARKAVEQALASTAENWDEHVRIAVPPE